MSGESEKDPIPGIPEMPAVTEVPGRLESVPGVRPEEIVERVGGEELASEVAEADPAGEVVRLSVEENRKMQGFRSGRRDGQEVKGVDAGLGVDVGLGVDGDFEGSEDEGEADVEDAWQDASRRQVPIGLIVLACMLVLVVLGVALWRIPRGDALLRERASAVSETMEAERREQQEAAALMNTIEDVLESYLAAETVEEKARFVRHPERVFPLMQGYYGEHELVPQHYERVKSFYPVGVENYPFLVVEVVLESGAMLPLLLQQIGDDEIRLDWEAEVAYQPMSIAQFLEQRPEVGVDFRVYVSLDQFYAFEFADQREFVSLMLTERNSDGFLFGYVERGSAAHDEIARLLNESNKSQEAMLLRLRFLPGSLGTRSVLVEEVVAPRWAYMDGTGE